MQIRIQPSWLTALTPGIVDLNAPFDRMEDTFFFAGWKPENYPAKVKVTFPIPYLIEKINVLDGAGVPMLSIILKGGNNNEAILVELDAFMQWKEIPVKGGFPVTEIIFGLQSSEGDMSFGEIEIHGTPADDAGNPGTPDPVDPVDPDPLPEDWTGLAGAVGTNCFDWVEDRILSAFGSLRCYQMLEWTWRPGGIAVSPAYRDVDYDEWLTRQKKAGREVVWCANQRPAWFADNDKRPSWADGRMHRNGSDPENPESYREISEYYFQIAARYGRKKWDDAHLRVETQQQYPNAPVTTKKSGLNLLNYIEVENEPNRWWKPDWAQYTPQQFAAMLSACYDGHCGTMGDHVGIKTADETMAVAIGLADINEAYISAMRVWCLEHRADQQFPADVIGVHHYCNNANTDNPRINFGTHGVSPEADKLGDRLKSFATMVTKTLPEVDELWLSEFGWDTNESSPQKAGERSLQEREENQGSWLVRGYLTAFDAGFDRAFMYNAIDEVNPNDGLFQSSGVATGNNARQIPKPAWFKIAKLQEVLQGACSVDTTYTNGVGVAIISYFYDARRNTRSIGEEPPPCHLWWAVKGTVCATESPT